MSSYRKCKTHNLSIVYLLSHLREYLFIIVDLIELYGLITKY